jgi:PPK2 family polyphosphate:nucleotide phosphotransferase
MHVGRFRIRPGVRVSLKKHAADFTGRFRGKDEALEELQKGVTRLGEQQERLYAQSERALLLIFQGMDAAGKDSAIKHVMSGVSPLGTDVHSFKRPSDEELRHDFLWRAAKVLPERGQIGMFDRSYYEEVLVVRVHPEILASQRLPADCVGDRIWEQRFEDINAFERHLWRNGTVVRKFFLNVSRSKQRKRLLERLEEPDKHWKFSVGDLPERAKWNAYMSAYEGMLSATSTAHSPWYVIPADHKWFAHVVIAELIVRTLDEMDLAPPALTRERQRELREARRLLKS